MNRSRAIFAVAALSLAPAVLRAQDSRLDARLDARTRDSVVAIVDSARAGGIPSEPLVQKARPGDTLQGMLVASNALGQPQKLTVVLEGRGLTADQTWELEVPAGATVSFCLLATSGNFIRSG